jgi:hypothetical protein
MLSPSLLRAPYMVDDSRTFIQYQLQYHISLVLVNSMLAQEGQHTMLSNASAVAMTLQKDCLATPIPKKVDKNIYKLIRCENQPKQKASTTDLVGRMIMYWGACCHYDSKTTDNKAVRRGGVGL